MGEAKYRKANDPHYGKQAESKYKNKISTVKGLILSHPFTLDGDSITAGTFDTQDLRFALTYWDRLAWTQNNIIGTPIPADIEYLQTCGVLSLPKINFNGAVTDIGGFLLEARELTLMMYEQEDEGAWSIHEGANAITRVGDDYVQTGTVIQLLNAVPIPGKEVPLAEILEFKARRRDELLAFRDHFEKLFGGISSADFMESELKKTLIEIDKSCANLIKTTREWQFPVKLSSTKATLNFDLKNAVATAASTYKLLSTELGLSQTTSAISAAGAAVVSQIKLSSELGFQKINRPRSPYKYAYLVERDLCS
ncbi:DUF6236 family protein [Pseudomonas sp. GM60]|uniref:DUF6236 family protein n=1 Tax=Pseudomonas sp. GM60 TaxID=1144334 RepID=UPI0002706DF6|nr:DUF6236 family protein [Pseudomonas sp. GM60]EJM83130.1 hypothetical protein PMI32_02387 [Pseudomonas sp. GM60]